MIEGVVLTKLNQIKDERGKIMHMMRNDYPIFKKFGEIYFSTVKPTFVKAWHLHKEATLNYVCIKGKVKLVLYDDRNKSNTRGEYQEYILSPSDYFMVTIPPLVWNGFKGVDKDESIIANCMTIPHNENEMVRTEHTNKDFNYNWN
tara:strand:- start:924 stop:1361 length:438 start_codon:yes stop_codon:yes gene_type:complete